jgi:hypothetical protein
VKGQCPRPLDDRDKHISSFGGAKRDRTAHLLHAMQALYQLSYSPEEGAYLNGVCIPSQAFLTKYFKKNCLLHLEKAYAMIMLCF